MAYTDSTHESAPAQPENLPASRRRRQVGKKTRFEVFKRDKFTCQYCGAHPPGVLLQVDHITPVASGGTNDIDNLVTSCQPCNIGKGARSLHSVPQSLADKAREIAEREQQLEGYQSVLDAKRLRLDKEVWRIFRCIYGEECNKVLRDEYNGVRIFVEKLGFHEVIESAEIALGKKRIQKHQVFRYFCGICWSKIRLQEGSRA